MKIKQKILSAIASALLIYSTISSLTASAASNNSSKLASLNQVLENNLANGAEDDEASTYGMMETIPLRIYNCSTNTYTSSEFVSHFMYTETESYSSGYFPSSRERGASTYAIVGDDNRTTVTNAEVAPYSATCYIRAYFTDWVYMGTGFLINSNMVLTCGHLIYNRDDNQMPTKVDIFPAMNGADYNANGVIKYSAKRIVCSENYILNSNYKDDWAVIEIDNHNIGYSYGWLGLRWRGGTFAGDDIWNTGYPSDNNAPVGQNAYGTKMMLGKGRILDCDQYSLKGTWDATRGNSGGPVFARYSYGGYDAIGILTTGSSDSTFGQDYGTAYSTATRFTRGLYDLFVQCKSEGISSLI